MSSSLAAILGGAAGAVALVWIAIILIWFCLFRRTSVSRTSETGSSDPSQGKKTSEMSLLCRKMYSVIICKEIPLDAVGRHGGIESQTRDTRRFVMEELSIATKNFNDKNLIGEGKFGEVYKGLLQDGMLVAIKKRRGVPTPEFVDEVIR